jgi:hypothetical protein
MPPLETGYGWWFFPSQVVGQFICTVCGSACEVSRDVDGPTSWAEAMARKHHIHDRFVCPKADEPWHGHAVQLVKWIEACPSPSAADLARRDLDALLAEHAEIE